LVVASDISAAMLALAAARPADPRQAPIEYLECPASAITAPDDSFDAVLCQHGLQMADLRDVRVETVILDAKWQTAEAATATLLGTPFGPLVSALPAIAQEQIRAHLASKLSASADGVTVRTASNVARGLK
jgi:methyltransferase family protein